MPRDLGRALRLADEALAQVSDHAVATGYPRLQLCSYI